MRGWQSSFSQRTRFTLPDQQPRQTPQQQAPLSPREQRKPRSTTPPSRAPPGTPSGDDDTPNIRSRRAPSPFDPSASPSPSTSVAASARPKPKKKRPKKKRPGLPIADPPLAAAPLLAQKAPPSPSPPPPPLPPAASPPTLPKPKPKPAQRKATKSARPRGGLQEIGRSIPHVLPVECGPLRAAFVMTTVRTPAGAGAGAEVQAGEKAFAGAGADTARAGAGAGVETEGVGAVAGTGGTTKGAGDGVAAAPVAPTARLWHCVFVPAEWVQDTPKGACSALHFSAVQCSAVQRSGEFLSCFLVLSFPPHRTEEKLKITFYANT